MKVRIIYDAILVLLVLCAPAWIYLPAIGVGLVCFRTFWEGVVLAALVDAVFAPAHGLGHWIITLSAVGLSVVMLPVRDRMRLSSY